jgi:hypothetical protein
MHLGRQRYAWLDMWRRKGADPEGLESVESDVIHSWALDSLELHQVRYFVALAANARRRGVAQPTLTIGTKALERKLGGRGDLH